MNRSYDQGDIVIADLEPARGSEQKGHGRLGVIVSSPYMNDLFRGVIICPITSATHDKQTDLGLTLLPAGEGGLFQDSFVIAFQIRMIDKQRIQSKIGTISQPFLEEVKESLRAVLDLD